MNHYVARLPVILTLAIGLGLVIHGPIHQPDAYHNFADQRSLFGIPRAADVISNIGFALVGVWALALLWPVRRAPAIAAGWPGYRLFLVSLILTAAGSSFYHLAPDNARLIWDRLPIALACAGLLAAVRAETHVGANGGLWATVLSILAAASVAWWYFTDRAGLGDLRPYLLLQGMPLLLIPLWQTIHHAARADRRAFGLAILLYLLAKVAELNDHELFASWQWISGHTVKHLFAIAASAVLAARLVQRVRRTIVPHFALSAKPRAG